MNTDTGQIVSAEFVAPFRAAGPVAQNLKEMQIPPTPQQMFRHPPRVGRNDPCPCGSGQKFKRCCWTGGA